MIRLGADRYEEKPDYIIFPTICHNLNSEEASMKLYYYFNNSVFTCYTECNDSYNIYELIDKRFMLCGRNRVENYKAKKTERDYTFGDILKFILETGQVTVYDDGEPGYQDIKKKFVKREQPKLITYPDKVLNCFYDYYPIEWIEEDISPSTMRKFNIKYSIYRNCAVIPHYNIKGELVGIRERNFEPDRIENLGKYRPIKIEDITYKHPLSLNLYGLNIVKENIKKVKKVIIFEGEKSALKSYEYFGNNSVGVACCGSHININQVLLLVKNFELNEIIIAFDKEYKTNGEFIEYSLKMKEMCEKYNQYCDFSFIRDKDNLLEYKDSPIDKGKEVFMKLLEERITIK